MPVNIPNFLQAPIIDTGYGDLVKSMIESYKGAAEARATPGKLREEQLQRILNNKLLGIDVEYKPEEYKSNIEHVKAGTGLLGQQTEAAKIKNDIERALGMKREAAGIGLTQAQTANFGAQTRRSNATLPFDVSVLGQAVEKGGYEIKQLRRQDQIDNEIYKQIAQSMQLANVGAGSTPEQAFGGPAMPGNSQAMPGQSGNVGQLGPRTTPPGGSAPAVSPAQQAKQTMAQAPGSVDASTPQQAEMVENRSQPNKKTTISGGNPQFANLDQLYLNNAATRVGLSKYFPHVGVNKEFNKTTGEMITTTKLPSGAVMTEVEQIGRSPENVEQAKKMAGLMVDTYKDANEAVKNSTHTGDALQLLNDMIKNEPNFNSAVGPIDKWFSNLRSEDKQRMQAAIETLSGEFVLGAVMDLKGATSGKELAFVNNIKPSTGDTGVRFAAKIRALTAMHEAMVQRATLIADFTYNNMPPHAAIAEARRRTDISQIQRQYDMEVKESQDLAGKSLAELEKMRAKAIGSA